VQAGQWRTDRCRPRGKSWHSVTYAVNWLVGSREAPLVLSVLEDTAAFEREVAVFARTMWIWLGGAALLLLLAQLLLLRWGLAPLRRVAAEVSRVERGEQAGIEGRYPDEIVALTDNLNTLIQQERVRQSRYKEALSFLAHSLKTPLAVLRNALAGSAGAARGGAAAGAAHGRHRAAPAGPRRRRRRHAVRAAGARRAGAGAHRRRAAQGLRRTRHHVVGRVPARPRLAHRRRRPVRGGRQRDGQRGQVGPAARDRHRVDGGWVALAGGRGRRPGFSDTQSILQLHVRLDERVPGHGVGLAVVADLVASHHGDLKLEAAASGGARVAITLPPP
jgi:two-component system sensor histidine kinase PhoQ